ncbi:MAG: hypothetical protein JJU07_13965 [Natronohydrobacter sp.]|nr:hypothetical protein [Natronohydrobacter sp.]
MHFALTTLDTLVRPRLMVVAARHGLNDYNRDVLLPRLLELPIGQALPDPQTALEKLMARERALEAARRHHDASWRAAAHVAVMTALLFEARTCARTDFATGIALQ